MDQQPSKRKRVHRVWMTVSIVAVAVTLIVSLVVVRPGIPDRIALLTGPEGGTYHDLGLRYAEDLRRRGLNVDVVATGGIVDNLTRLADGGEVVAFAPSMLDADDITSVDVSRLVSLASVGLEPLWVFSRSGLDIRGIADLSGRTLYTGARGTVSNVVARRVIDENGLAESVTIEPVSGTTPGALADAFASGKMDVAIVTGHPKSPIVESFLAADGLSILSLERAAAYEARVVGLTQLVAPQGVFDLARNVPPRDTHMLSAATCLIAHEDLHSAVVPMFLVTAQNLDERSTELSFPVNFPSGEHVPFPLDVAARRFFSDGETGLSKIFPYKVTRWLNHLGVMVAPLLAIVILLLKIVPVGLRMWMGIRLKRLFIKMVAIEKAHAAGEDREKLLAELDGVDRASARMMVPRESAPDYVDFRQFLSDMRDRVKG